MISQIKCPSCGIYNTNKAYCENCNTLLSSKIRRALQFEKEENARLEKSKHEENYSNHRFLVVRVIAKTIRSIWLGFVAVGVFIAWLVTAVAG